MEETEDVELARHEQRAKVERALSLRLDDTRPSRNPEVREPILSNRFWWLLLVALCLTVWLSLHSFTRPWVHQPEQAKLVQVKP